MSAIKTTQDAPSWMWYHWKLSFLLGGLYRFTLFPSIYGIKMFTPASPTKLIITYFDHAQVHKSVTKSMYKYPTNCQHCNDRPQLQLFIHNSKFLSLYQCFGDYRTIAIVSDFYWSKTMLASFGIAVTKRHGTNCRWLNHSAVVRLLNKIHIHPRYFQSHHPWKGNPRVSKLRNLLWLYSSHLLGGWTNPFEKFAKSQNGHHFPKNSGWKFQTYLNCH